MISFSYRTALSVLKNTMKVTIVSPILFVAALSATVAFAKNNKKNGEGRSLRKRIIGGSQADRDEFPFYARFDIDGFTHCGATLVAPDVVMTAAHCSRQIDKWVAIVNAYSRTIDYEGHIPVDVVARLPHPQFGRPTFMNNDVALVKLSRPVWEVATLIEINTDPNFPAKDQPVTVIGLGDTSIEPGSQYKDELQKVQVISEDHGQCQQNFRQWNVVIPEETMICLGVPQGGKVSQKYTRRKGSDQTDRSKP